MTEKEPQLVCRDAQQPSHWLPDPHAAIQAQLGIGQLGLHVAGVIAQEFKIAFVFGCVNHHCIFREGVNGRPDLLIQADACEKTAQNEHGEDARSLRQPAGV